MATVFDAANFFIDIAAHVEDDPITNLKLNKLLYYAQGCCLSRLGRPLFPEQIEAWDYGPVVPAVYHKYKVCGKSPIRTTDDDYDRGVFTEEETAVLIDVMREYGQYTGHALVSKTHQTGTPWRQTVERGSKIIPHPSMKAYFDEHPVPMIDAAVSRIPVADRLPAEWYDPEEDSVWDSLL